MRILATSMLMLVASVPAFACSFGGAEKFKPTLENWEQHPGPRQRNKNAEGDYWEKVPVPVVSVISVGRGSAKPGSSCADAGTIELEISLPTTSTYAVSEFGIYFRVLSGKLPDEIFPAIPLVGEVKNGKMHILLAWLDGHPNRQFPLDLKVEAFLLSNDLSIGMPATFTVKAGVGG